MANQFDIDPSNDTHLLNETFHIFSKSPASNTTTLGGAKMKSGHTTTSSDVWSQEIPAFFNAPTSATFTKYEAVASTDDLCLYNGKVWQHDGTSFVELGTVDTVLTDGKTFSKNGNTVIKYHKGRTAINLTADNNNGDGANNLAAKIYNAATGSTTFVSQFISSTDKFTQGIPSDGYNAVVTGDGQPMVEGLTNDDDYICNAYAGVIQFNKVRAQNSVIVSAWEYIGEKLDTTLSNIEGQISSAVAGAVTSVSKTTDCGDAITIGGSSEESTPNIKYGAVTIGLKTAKGTGADYVNSTEVTEKGYVDEQIANLVTGVSSVTITDAEGGYDIVSEQTSTKGDVSVTIDTSAIKTAIDSKADATRVTTVENTLWGETGDVDTPLAGSALARIAALEGTITSKLVYKTVTPEEWAGLEGNYESNTIYLVPSDDAEAGEYIEYLTIDSNTVEEIGSTATDLSGYATYLSDVATKSSDANKLVKVTVTSGVTNAVTEVAVDDTTLVSTIGAPAVGETEATGLYAAIEKAKNDAIDNAKVKITQSGAITVDPSGTASTEFTIGVATATTEAAGVTTISDNNAIASTETESTAAATVAAVAATRGAIESVIGKEATETEAATGLIAKIAAAQGTADTAVANAQTAQDAVDALESIVAQGIVAEDSQGTVTGGAIHTAIETAKTDIKETAITSTSSEASDKNVLVSIGGTIASPVVTVTTSDIASAATLAAVKTTADGAVQSIQRTAGDEKTWVDIVVTNGDGANPTIAIDESKLVGEITKINAALGIVEPGEGDDPADTTITGRVAVLEGWKSTASTEISTLQSEMDAVEAVAATAVQSVTEGTSTENYVTLTVDQKDANKGIAISIDDSKLATEIAKKANSADIITYSGDGTISVEGEGTTKTISVASASESAAGVNTHSGTAEIAANTAETTNNSTAAATVASVAASLETVNTAISNTLSSANSYTDTEIAKITTGDGSIATRLTAAEGKIATAEGEIDALQTAVGTTLPESIADAKKAGTDAQDAVTALTNGAVATNTAAIATLNDAETVEGSVKHTAKSYADGAVTTANGYTDTKVRGLNATVQSSTLSGLTLTQAAGVVTGITIADADVAANSPALVSSGKVAAAIDTAVTINSVKVGETPLAIDNKAVTIPTASAGTDGVGLVKLGSTDEIKGNPAANSAAAATEAAVAKALDALNSKIEAIKGTGVNYSVLPEGSDLPAAGSDYLGWVYLKQDEASADGEYIEYICVNIGSVEAPVYSWEKIGSTKTDHSAFASSIQLGSATVEVTNNVANLAGKVVTGIATGTGISSATVASETGIATITLTSASTEAAGIVAISNNDAIETTENTNEAATVAAVAATRNAIQTTAITATSAADDATPAPQVKVTIGGTIATPTVAVTTNDIASDAELKAVSALVGTTAVATQIETAINGLNATVKDAETGTAITIGQTAGKLTSVALSIGTGEVQGSHGVSLTQNANGAVTLNVETGTVEANIDSFVTGATVHATTSALDNRITALETGDNSVATQITNAINELDVAGDSVNGITWSQTDGKVSISVTADTEVTEGSTNVVTSGAVATAIATAQAAATTTIQKAATTATDDVTAETAEDGSTTYTIDTLSDVTLGTITGATTVEGNKITFTDGSVKYVDWSRVTNAANAFSGSKTTLTSFHADLGRLTNGNDMFRGCSKLTSFCGNLSSLAADGAEYMFSGCALDEESVIYIIDSLPTVSEGTISIGVATSVIAPIQTAYVQEAKAKGWTVSFVQLGGND